MVTPTPVLLTSPGTAQSAPPGSLPVSGWIECPSSAFWQPQGALRHGRLSPRWPYSNVLPTESPPLVHGCGEDRDRAMIPGAGQWLWSWALRGSVAVASTTAGWAGRAGCPASDSEWWKAGEGASCGQPWAPPSFPSILW